MYYGPDFKILYYYNNPIYFDRSELRPEYGPEDIFLLTSEFSLNF
mgnify:CR=1 FL=1